MRLPHPLTAAAAVLLATGLALVPAGAEAKTRTIHDTESYDHKTAVIDMTKLTVTYDRKGAHAELHFKNIKKQKRMRIFVAFYNRPSDDPFAPNYGNFLELRVNEKAKTKVTNWVINPTYDDYDPQKCKGVKVKADYYKDVVKYNLPKRCARFLKDRGYIISYASARKFKAKHWDEGSPADTTGTWFDTTPGLRIPR